MRMIRTGVARLSVGGGVSSSKGVLELGLSVFIQPY
jgi:hypothetical protein